MTSSSAMGAPAPAAAPSNNTAPESRRQFQNQFRPAEAVAGTATLPAAPALPLAQQQASAMLVQLYDYVQANIQQYPTLANALPSTMDALTLYRNGLYPQSLAQTLLIFQWIQNQAGAFPALPLG
jgi:hypothetical protein